MQLQATEAEDSEGAPLSQEAPRASGNGRPPGAMPALYANSARLLSHDARPPWALIASIRTRFQISSTLSMKPLFLKMAGSLLSNLVSTMALMRPGRADFTATRSAR